MATIQISTVAATSASTPFPHSVLISNQIQEAIYKANKAGFGRVLSPAQLKELIDWSKMLLIDWGGGDAP